jgi:hypothetical protein
MLTELPVVRILRSALVVEGGMLGVGKVDGSCRGSKAYSRGRVIKLGRERRVVMVVV